MDQDPKVKARLEAAGWKFMAKQRHKYGFIYYWDHPDLQRIDGRWWTQGDAVIRQNKRDKE